MIQAIKELGEIKLKMEQRKVTDLVSILVEDPNDTGRYPKTLVVVFEEREGGFNYVNVLPEDTDKGRVNRYLYKFYAPNGPDYTPTARISESISKTFHNKIVPWFEQNSGITPLIDKFREAFLKSKDQILVDLEAKWAIVGESLKRNQSGIITFGIRDVKGFRYLGDIQDFREILVSKVRDRYQKISTKDHICSVCGKIAEEVYGNAIPFPFYTLDKPGYIAGGFKEQEAWKNAPVCLECSLKIEEGKKLLDSRLTYRMGGQRYYLIPRFVISTDVMRDFFEIVFSGRKKPEEVLSREALQRISEDEREILGELCKFKDVVTFSFMFFETPTRSVFRITLLVEDVLPSRLSQIFQAKRRADACDFLHKVKIQNQLENVEFNFYEFRRFSPSNKAFLEVVDKCFRGLPINRELIFLWIMRVIRQGFANDLYLKPAVLRGLSALLFFHELGVLRQVEHQSQGGATMTELSQAAEGFFSRYESTFLTPAHKALFLLGVLTQKLLNVQYADREATPFRKNLKGLKMREEDFQGLLPKVQNKLWEYDRSFPTLEALISEYFLLAGRNWRLSVDEINFYFVLGMNLSDKVIEALNL